jgi:plasmid stabilization system protein ParE
MKVVIGRRTARQLDLIRRYLNERNPAAATTTLARIRSTIERIGDYPYSAVQRGGAEARQATVPRTPYVVIYRVGVIHVEILGVFHAARHPSVRSRP